MALERCRVQVGGGQGQGGRELGRLESTARREQLSLCLGPSLLAGPWERPQTRLSPSRLSPGSQRTAAFKLHLPHRVHVAKP